MASFVRQLNNYGFSKVARGDGLPQYFHKYFVLGKWDLLYKIAKVSEKPLSSDSGETDKKKTLGCRVCKELPGRVVKLENTVNYLLQQVKQLQLVNQALTSYISADKMKENLDKAAFNPEELLILGHKRKKKRFGIHPFLKVTSKEPGYFGDHGDQDLENSSDSGGSVDDIYNEKEYNKKLALKKPPGFDFEGF